MGAAMLTVLLLAFDSPARSLRRDAVARSLASLVEACVNGVVADAILVGAPDGGLDRIADDSGCARVECARADVGLPQALALARLDDIFLLEAGYAVDRGFVEEVGDALAFGADRALILRAAPHSLLTRLAPPLAAPVGLIANKAALRQAGGADLRRLARKLKGADLTTSARRVF